MVTITANTSLLGLIGQPVNHSLSPAMHNAALQEMGLNWCYIALPCDKKNLPIVTKALKAMNFQGLNITIPHKESIFKLCDDVTNIAKEIQAVNTLIRNEKNTWTGTNTDIEGFLIPLRKKDMAIKNAIVIGCGGSARAIVTGLKQMKLKSIIVIGRNQVSLTKFIQDMNKSTINNNNQIIIKGIIDKDKDIVEYIRNANLIINTTPIGMHSHSKTRINDVPLGMEIWNHLNIDTILYDLIYTPRPTQWLQIGINKKCITIDGLDMLVEQGAASLRLWSGIKDIPIQKMKLHAEKALL